MQLTVKFKLDVSRCMKEYINDTMFDYISTVNDLVNLQLNSNTKLKLSSKDISKDIPSALKNQAILDSKSVVKKYNKSILENNTKPKKKQKDVKDIKVPILVKPIAVWNNQNYDIYDNSISFPVYIDGKCKRLIVKCKRNTRLYKCII